jgi:hypothetical protein
MCQWLHRRDKNFYQVEILFFKGGRRLTKMATTLKNNYAFRKTLTDINE